MPVPRMDHDEAAATLQRAARRRSSLGAAVPITPPDHRQASNRGSHAPPSPGAGVAVGHTASGGSSGGRRSPNASSTPPFRAQVHHCGPPPSPPAAAAAAAATSPEGVAPYSAGGSKQRLPFSCEEEALLCRLWHEKGFALRKRRGERYKWKEILDDGKLTFHPNRTSGDLKDKARNIGLLDLASAPRTTAPMTAEAELSPPLRAPLPRAPPSSLPPALPVPASPWEACRRDPGAAGGAEEATTTTPSPSPQGAVRSAFIDLRLDESSSSDEIEETAASPRFGSPRDADSR